MGEGLKGLLPLQALSRNSRGFSTVSKRTGSGRLAKSGSLDGALKPKQMHLELELVAIGVGLQFVELEEGRKVTLWRLPQASSSKPTTPGASQINGFMASLSLQSHLALQAAVLVYGQYVTAALRR